MLSTIQKLMFAFVTLIIGLVLIGSIATSTETITSLTGFSDNIDISPALRSVSTSNVNITHGTYFLNTTRGTYYYPALGSETITTELLLNDTRDLACSKPVVTNSTSGEIIAEGNWSWSTTAQAKGRCGITFTDAAYPNEGYNNTRWNLTYTATYNDVNGSVSSMTISQVPTGWKATECPINTIQLTNRTVTLVLNTDYNYTAASGIISLKPSLTNNFSAGSSYIANYEYCSDSYISGWAGSVLALVPGFFALAILIFSVGMFYSLAREAGIL